MTFKKRMLGLAGVLSLAGALAPQGAAASVDSQFKATMTRLITNSDRKEVAKWDKEQRAIMAACISEIVPQKKKQYVLAGGASEFGARFEEVKAEDRYAIERKINQTCLKRLDRD